MTAYNGACAAGDNAAAPTVAPYCQAYGVSFALPSTLPRIAELASDEGYDEGYADGLAAFPIDETPPTVTPVLAEGEIDPDYDIASVTFVTIDVTDETELATIVVSCITPDASGAQCVFRRGDFVSPFDAFSYTSTPVAGTTRLHIRRNTPWNPGSIELLTDVVDGGGNLDTE